jgi:hypothetical protein
LTQSASDHYQEAVEALLVFSYTFVWQAQGLLGKFLLAENAAHSFPDEKKSLRLHTAFPYSSPEPNHSI